MKCFCSDRFYFRSLLLYKLEYISMRYCGYRRHRDKENLLQSVEVVETQVYGMFHFKLLNQTHQHELQAL